MKTESVSTCLVYTERSENSSIDCFRIFLTNTNRFIFLTYQFHPYNSPDFQSPFKFNPSQKLE